jgi:hypothetical protein
MSVRPSVQVYGCCVTRHSHHAHERVRDSAVGWGIALQAGRSRVRFPMWSFEIFHWLKPSGRNMVLGSTQPLRGNEYQGSSRGVLGIILGDKGGRCVGLTLPPSCADCLNILGASTSWSPQGLRKPVMGCLCYAPANPLTSKQHDHTVSVILQVHPYK